LTRRNPPTVWTKNDPIHGAAPGVPNLWHSDQGSISQKNGKVGKGLLKDENAQKLALQHWLEAAALEEILYQFEEKLQAEREEAARKQEELQAQLQAQQAALEENQSLLRQAQEEVKGMHTKFEETNALLRAVLKLQKD